jgi:hypothetical protein
MHPSLKLKQFHGTADINGAEREVVFSEADTHGPSVLAIKGLTVEDALYVIGYLEASLQGKKEDSRGLQPHHNGAAAAKQDKPAKQKAKEPEPEPEPAVEPEPDDVDADLDAEVDGDASIEMDLATMQKMSKIRELVLYMKSRGASSPAKVVEAARRFKDQIPILREVDAKGHFDKRIERAAITIIEAEVAAS